MLLQKRKEKKRNQRRAIQCDFEHVGPTLLKNPLGVGLGLPLQHLVWCCVVTWDHVFYYNVGWGNIYSLTPPSLSIT